MRPLQRSLAAAWLRASAVSKNHRQRQLCHATLVRLLSDAADHKVTVNGCDSHVLHEFQHKANGQDQDQRHGISNSNSTASHGAMASLFSDSDQELRQAPHEEHDDGDDHDDDLADMPAEDDNDVDDFTIDPRDRLDSELEIPTRRETRREAIHKAEQLLAVLRNSMTEMEISQVTKRIGQHAVNPQLSARSHETFRRSLQSRFGPSRAKELEYTLAFLEGHDELMQELVDKHFQEDFGGNYDGLKVAGLRPDLMADPRFISVVLYFCRVACLNSLSLYRHSFGNLPSRSKKQTLGQLKKDFRRVLEAENMHQYVAMLGLELEVPESVRNDEEDDDGLEEHDLALGTENLESDDDAEWDQVNLEDDLIDFKLHSKHTEKIAQLLKENLSDESIALVINSMLNSVKSSRLHRKIFQEMVCEVGVLVPEELQKGIIGELIPFLSADNATWEDFQSQNAKMALRHHRLRRQTILRSLLECRMRVGQIEIPDLDENVDGCGPLSVSDKLTKAQRDKVITAAWNLVNVIDERRYHVFFNRFLKHKLVWRPNQRTIDDIFFVNMRTILGERDSELLMPLLERVHADLSIETLTICRIKAQQTKWMRHPAKLSCGNDLGEQHKSLLWPQDCTVFYSNLPDQTTEQNLIDGLRKVGEVERAFVFTLPDRFVPGRDDAEDADELNKTNRTSRRRKAELVIASDKHTNNYAAVQFKDPYSASRALQSALRIFGVLISNGVDAANPEKRAAFASQSSDRCTIVLQRIPFSSTVGDILDKTKAILHRNGLHLKVDCSLPRGVFITKGIMELEFESFQEAALALHFLDEHVKYTKQEINFAAEEARKRQQEAKEKAKERRKELEKQQKKEQREHEKQEKERLKALEAAANGTKTKSKKVSTKASPPEAPEAPQAPEESLLEPVATPRLDFEVTWKPESKRKSRMSV